MDIENFERDLDEIPLEVKSNLEIISLVPKLQRP